MTTLWQRMGDIFLAQWDSNCGPVGGETYQTWKRGLANYSESQLRHGVQMCMRWTDKFIPNLGQFASLCLSSQGKSFTDKRIEQERIEGKSIRMIEHDRRQATREIAENELGKMRRILAGESA